MSATGPNPFPADQDLTFYQGVAFLRTITYAQGNGLPVDLTGWAARMEIRPVASAASSILLAFSTSPRTGEATILLVPKQGSLILHAPASLTATLANWPTAPSPSYELRLTPPNGDDEVILTGSVQLIPRTTFPYVAPPS